MSRRTDAIVEVWAGQNHDHLTGHWSRALRQPRSHPNPPRQAQLCNTCRCVKHPQYGCYCIAAREVASRNSLAGSKCVSNTKYLVDASVESRTHNIRTDSSAICETGQWQPEQPMRQRRSSGSSRFMSILAADVPTVRPAILRGLEELADNLVRRCEDVASVGWASCNRADRIALQPVRQRLC